MWDKLKHFSKKSLVIILVLAVAALLLGGLIYSSISTDEQPPAIYRIAIDETWYPLNLYGKEQYLTLFSEELLGAIAVQQHFPVQLRNVGAVDLLDGIDSGKYEGALSSLVLTGRNADKYAASDPYYLLGPVLVVSISSDIKSLNDIHGKSIGLMSRANPVEELDKFSDAHFVFYDFDDRMKLIKNVSNGFIDGMVLNMIPAYEYAKNDYYNDRLKVVSKPLNNEGLRLIAKDNKKSRKIIDEFNKGLEAIKKNGVYDKLIKKWGLVNPEKL